MDSAAQALSERPSEAGDDYAAALERWLALGVSRPRGAGARQWCKKSGSVCNFETPMTALSGGQAARAGLASLLLSRYDIFLLDEPTNDLDLEGLDRLERFVGDVHRQGSPLVVVSHDREFLSRVVTRVVEIDRAQHQVNVFGGGYEAYLQEREVARQHARDSYEEYAETLGNLQARARTQRAWMEKGVRNARRKATDNDKFVRNFRGGDEREAGGQSAPDRSPMIERLEEAQEPRKEWQLRMSIAQAPRAGAVVASLRNALVHRGSFTLGPGVAADRLGRPGGHHRRQRQRQVDTARRAARPAAAGRRRRRASAREWWSARSIRHGRRSKNPGHFLMFSGNRCPRWARRSYARCWPNSASAPRLSTGRRHRFRRGSAPGRHLPYCKRKASTCSCSTNRRITLICRRSSSSNRRSKASTARCCW